MRHSIDAVKLIMICLLAAFFTLNSAGAVDDYNKMEFLQQSLTHPQLTRGPTDDPPLHPVIAVAEWEPSTGVLIRYPLWIPLELVVEMAEELEVMTVVDNEETMQDALFDYARAGVNTSNCTFLFSQQLTWPHTRDFGPWYIFDGNGEQGLINNDYFWYEPYSRMTTMVPVFLGDTLGIPVYDTGIRDEGGNYMTDGMGTVIDTDWVLTVNPIETQASIDAVYEEYLGITRHFTRDCSPAYHHVDTWAKFLDPGRILILQPDPPDLLIEESVAFFQSLMSAYGRPFKVIRIQGRGYTNSTFLNNKVLVPLYDNQNDSLALETFQEAMPGYEILGFYHQGGGTGFGFGDAIHCRTHEMADCYMLRIAHIPLHDRENDGNDYCIEANVHAYSNEPLFGSPLIYWKVEGGSYNTVAMMHVSGDDYTGYIPQQSCDTDIYYFLHADDESGRSENHPYIGEGNPHHFYVGPDNEAPVVEFNPPEVISSWEWPFLFKAYVLDNRWISSVTLEYLINGFLQDPVEMPLIEPYAVYYSAMTSGEVQAGDFIDVRVKAVDTSVNQNTTYSPYYTIAVEGAEEVVGAQLQNRVSPNPFNPQTTIQFTLPEALRVNLSVYDVSGRRIVKLVDGWRDGGVQEVTWDASELASGIYVYRLETGGFSATGKMVLMK